MSDRVMERDTKVSARSREKQEPAQWPWWEQVLGTFEDDPAYEEAMRLGREWRESQPIPEPDDEEVGA